jgi:TonB family protein
MAVDPRRTVILVLALVIGMGLVVGQRPTAAARQSAPAPTPPGVGAGGPIRVGGDITEPVKIKDVTPIYPAEARAQGIQGLVIIELTIGTEGRVTGARVLRAHPLLSQAALDAVTQWEYAPTLIGGKPVPVLMTVTVNFQLRGANLADAARPGAGGPFSECPDSTPLPLDLSGTWTADDGATYSIRTVCQEIFWSAGHVQTSSAHVFYGRQRLPGEYAGRWAEVPPSTTRHTGALTIRARSKDEIDVVGAPATFPARLLKRIEPTPAAQPVPQSP